MNAAKPELGKNGGAKSYFSPNRNRKNVRVASISHLFNQSAQKMARKTLGNPEIVELISKEE